MNDETTKEFLHLREVVELKFENTEKALQLQAKEIERRLEILNGEAGRLREMQSTYLPREVYEANHSELTDKVSALSKIVYIGLGIVLTLQVILKFILH